MTSRRPSKPRSLMLQWMLVTAMVALLPTMRLDAAPPAEKPNIVFIMVDDK